MVSRFPLFVVDAFTDRPFAGNPAAVCLLPAWQSDSWLQQVGREMNLSETAFLVRNAGGFDLRWFTPKVEVDLCGHATLASAHVLWQENLANTNGAIQFTTRSGILSAAKRGDDIELDFPLKPEEIAPMPDGLAEALGAKPVYVGLNQFDYLVELTTESALRGLAPDFPRLAKLGVRGVIVTSRSDDAKFDFVSRFFAPGSGINEDPVTGSAHCCLAGFWRKRLGKTDFVAYQASERGGVVKVRIQGERVLLGGRAVTISKGELFA
ncbi:MAG: PhzF family phenazine biosynthesis protein [Gemmataceae bacterium]|nr:PhzF family phenazine biosynthesis protein [Gemmataceae bacterium]MCI0738352.1 PhzF family phenazine biosynthesis protein [Gemmataceae bacterium]